MDSRETINNLPYRLTFPGILALIAFLYVGGFFISGRLMTELPTNWFTNWISGIFSLMDSEGFFNVWSGITPGIHYLYFLVWKPLYAIAGDQWYFTTVFSLLWFFLTTVFVFLSACLFYKIIEHINGNQRATILGTLFIVLMLTFDWYTVIDSFAIAAFLGGIYYSLKNSGKRAGILLGISTVLKPLGFVILPVLIKSDFTSRKTKMSLVITSALSIAGLLLPFMIGNFNIFMSSFNWQSGRAPWETVYSLILRLTNAPLPSSFFFQDYSGVVPRNWAWSGITPVHSIMTTHVPSFGTWYSYVFAFLLVIVFLAFLLFKKVRNGTELMWGGLFAMVMFYVVFYGWSVQFLYWLAPFALAVLPIGVTIMLKVIGWLEYPLFYGLYLARVAPDLVSSIAGMSTTWTMELSFAGPVGFWTLVIVRTLVFLGLGLLAWKKLPTHLWEPVARRLSSPVGIPAYSYNSANHRYFSGLSKGGK